MRRDGTGREGSQAVQVWKVGGDIYIQPLDAAILLATSPLIGVQLVNLHDPHTGKKEAFYRLTDLFEHLKARLKTATL